VILRKLLQTTNSNLYMSFRLVAHHLWWPRMAFEGHFFLCCYFHVQYLINYTRYAQLMKSPIRNHTTAFRWYDCRWPWQYFKVTGLIHAKLLVNGAWYGNSYYRGNHTLAFDWCHFCWPWGMDMFWRSSVWIGIPTSTSAIFGRLSCCTSHGL